MAQTSAMTPPDLPLRDIHLPVSIGWWPVAPGWWLLCGLLLLLFISFWGLRRFYQRRRMRRLAIQQLDRLADLSGTPLVTALSRLLRQAAIIHFPCHDCAGLAGQEWLEFLDRPFTDHPFTTGVGRCLSVGPYQKETQIDVVALVDLCRRWLKKLPSQKLPPGRKL